MNNIEIINLTNEEIKELNDVKYVIDKAIEIEKLNDLEFNIIIVDNEYIHKLNRDYRKIDRPTDVITFALEDYEDIKLEHRMLGDIYISIDKCYSQAMEYGLCYLAVHGLLHLLGYDHMEKEDEVIMFSKQELILNEAGIKK